MEWRLESFHVSWWICGHFEFLWSSNRWLCAKLLYFKTWAVQLPVKFLSSVQYRRTTQWLLVVKSPRNLSASEGKKWRFQTCNQSPSRKSHSRLFEGDESSKSGVRTIGPWKNPDSVNALGLFITILSRTRKWQDTSPCVTISFTQSV